MTEHMSVDDCLLNEVKNGDSAGVKHWITQGANTNYIDDQGYPVLIHAISLDNAHPNKTDIITTLLENYADVDAGDPKNQTALFYAIRTNNVELVELIFKYNPNITHLNASGRSPLCHAAAASSVHIVKLLIDKGANVNHKSFKDGCTPLHAAVFGQNTEKHEVIEYMVSRGANIYQPDNENRVPINLIEDENAKNRIILAATRKSSGAKPIPASNATIPTIVAPAPKIKKPANLISVPTVVISKQPKQPAPNVNQNPSPNPNPVVKAPVTSPNPAKPKPPVTVKPIPTVVQKNPSPNPNPVAKVPATSPNPKPKNLLVSVVPPVKPKQVIAIPPQEPMMSIPANYRVEIDNNKNF